MVQWWAENGYDYCVCVGGSLPTTFTENKARCKGKSVDYDLQVGQRPGLK